MIQQISIRLPEELYKAIKDKSKQIWNSRVTYGEWQRIYTAINETYKKETDTIAREMTVPAIEKIRKVYESIYL